MAKDSYTVLKRIRNSGPYKVEPIPVEGYNKFMVVGPRMKRGSLDRMKAAQMALFCNEAYEAGQKQTKVLREHLEKRYRKTEAGMVRATIHAILKVMKEIEKRYG